MIDTDDNNHNDDDDGQFFQCPPHNIDHQNKKKSYCPKAKPKTYSERTKEMKMFFTFDDDYKKCKKKIF